MVDREEGRGGVGTDPRLGLHQLSALKRLSLYESRNTTLRHDPLDMTIQIRQLEKVYRVGVERIHALRGIDLDIDRNEFVAIMGASGSGKSTLMNILGCLDKPTRGSYVLNGRPAHRLNATQLATVRNQDIGFVFQSFELLPRLTALANVMLPLIYSAKHTFRAKRMAREALDMVGLKDRMTHRPSQLSGGQRQRVAIARALVNKPAILLADEPTGNLDTRTSGEIIGLFRNLHASGQTIVVVTHEEDVAGHAARIVRLRDGRTLSDLPTDRDPIHREYLANAAAQIRALSESQGLGNTAASRAGSGSGKGGAAA